MTITITPRERIETCWVVTDRLRFLGQLPGTSVHLIEVEAPPASGTPPHTHASPELFLVTEGTLTLRSFGPDGGATFRLNPGESAAIGSMEPHNYANESDRPVRFLAMVDDTMIAFFRELGKDAPLAPGAVPDFASIAAAMARHGIGKVAPPG
jgi:quercetin dioxygenase-like cupin family protein